MVSVVHEGAFNMKAGYGWGVSMLHVDFRILEENVFEENVFFNRH